MGYFMDVDFIRVVDSRRFLNEGEGDLHHRKKWGNILECVPKYVCIKHSPVMIG